MTREEVLVAGDNFLMKDEKPFTDFGQWGVGKLDIRVFQQNVWWVNVAGEAFRLAEMSRDYRQNVLRFLYENQEYFHSMSQRAYAIDHLLLDFPHLFRNYEAYVLYMRDRAKVDDNSARWLFHTPLVQKLLSLLE